MTGTLVALLRLLADHVWQSTLFAGAIASLTLAFRRSRADVRYSLWLVASAKFLLPFAALVTLGASFGWTGAPLPPPELRLALDAAAQPFSPLPLSASRTTQPPDTGSANPWITPERRHAVLTGLAAIWMLGIVLTVVRGSVRWMQLRELVRRGTVVTGGRELEILRQLNPSIPMVSVESAIEPGIAGIIRPLLLWPATIGERLDDEQIAAILAHELAHVRRGDNLTAVLHMLVQAVFWWHPLVWWVGARLIDERERACDEAVLRGGNEPQRYAESILRTCEFYLESPLACVTGVTGGDLKRRIETIMRNDAPAAVGRLHKGLLSLTAVATLAAPIGVGVLRAPRLLAQAPPTSGSATFDAVSIKRNTSGAPGGTVQSQPGRYTATNINLRRLIQNAYGLLDSQIVGGPPPLVTADYMSAEKFDIQATFPAAATLPQRSEMMRNMLADRFKLVAHRETREMPVYALVRARPDGALGAALKPAADPECAAPAAVEARAAARAGGPPIPAAPPGGGPPPVGPVRCGALQFGPGQYTARSVPIAQLVQSISNQTPLTGIDRVVLDRTDLTGRFDFELRFRRATPPRGLLPAGVTPPPPDPDRPDLSTALQEQLGLKLESQRAPIEVLVLDRVEAPSEN